MSQLPVPRPFRYAPITPVVNGQPPAWIVTCACGYRADAHGHTAADAVHAVARVHGHRALTATAVDYSHHPLYQGA